MMPNLSRRGGYHARPGRGPHQCEGVEVDADGPGGWALADDDVQLVLLHGWIQDLLDGAAEAVYLVDEEHVPGLEVGEYGGQVPGLFDGRSARDPQAHLQLVGDDVCKGGLSKPRGP